MSTTISEANSPHQSVRGEPAWEIATLFPVQGSWSEAAYLTLRTNRMLELNDGFLEILPLPTYFHELIIEVVSPGTANRARDLDVKRVEYARAGIDEYWIVDPESRTITVLKLTGEEYHAVGEFDVTQTATSALLSEFSVSVRDTFNAAEAESS